MRKQVVLVLAILLNSLMFAQGGGFNYKALITNGGSALSNQAVDIKFTVLENGATNVYQETHSVTTDANGIVIAIVGEGNTVSGDFTTIDWGNNSYFLKVEIDSGSGYQNFGTNELKAVPYAKFAEKAASVDYNNLTNVPTGLDDADFYKAGTTTQPTDINDDIYTMGNVAIGKNTADFPLDIVSNTSDKGINLELSTGGTTDHYGVYNRLSGIGTGQQYGVRNSINNTGNNKHYGSYSTLSGGGSGIHYGSYNKLYGSGTGWQYGIKSYIYNTGNGVHYGSYAALSGSGSGTHYGSYNNLYGSGTGKQYGIKNSINNSGNAMHYGSYSYLSGSGSGIHYGNYNYLSGSGTGMQYGIMNNINNSGNATHFGSYSNLIGTGSGNKYGTYNKISTIAGGTHYAVYGEAKKSGSYAGYFDGDVQMTQKLKANDSGDADMKAYIYGAVTAPGSFGDGAHSDGFAVSKIVTGRYRITFTSAPGTVVAYTVITNMMNNNIGFISVKNYNSYFEIKTYDTSGTAADKAFNFVVYKK